MASNPRAADGIIVDSSGRMTYAPDGLVESIEEEETLASEQSSEVTPNIQGDESGNVYADTAFAPINAGDEHELTRIATKRSALNRPLSTVDTLTTIRTNDPSLDPQNKEFSLRRWLRVFMRNLDEEEITVKRAGIVFKDLAISGSGAALQLQATLGDLITGPARIGEVFKGHNQHKQILRNFNGTLKSGELLIVLGRPGSGCSTFLKSLCGELHGLKLDEGSTIHYNGITQKQMMKEFKGEVIYNQEVDKHFPHLTVGQTLEFAASARTPSNRIKGMSRSQYAKDIAKVIMTVFGLSHTYNTKVGSDFVRGVSGGERKRVSIAEMALATSPIAAWDNSTRGLDSATAFKFVQSLRLLADLGGSTHAVAIYQASQAIYDSFDKAIVLYEGRQIYFGPANKAKRYFEEQGWYCPPRQTTGDFLTSITNPAERQTRNGMDKRVPRTPDEFEAYWQRSEAFKAVRQEMEQYEQAFPMGGNLIHQFREQKRDAQADHTRAGSPFLISWPMQVKLNTKRAYQRMWNDISSTFTTFVSNMIMGLIIGSVFYNNPNTTNGFFGKGSVLFFAVLLNALTAMSEINSLYAQRAIVEKHASYAFYHPATEAIAGIVADVPIKLTLAVGFNIIVYFLANLRREPSQFFLYFLIVFTIMFVMSAVFRTMAAITKTVAQAMTLAGILVLVLVVYTGFVLPVPYMKPWFAWLHYLNPIYYAFEILVANEFHGRDFACSTLVPSYAGLTGDTFSCSTAGSVAGETYVSGDAYIAASYEYYYSNVWRNFGILIAFLFGFMAIYFVATELNSSTTSTAEVLVFRRGHVPASVTQGKNDEESDSADVSTKEGKEGEGVNAIPAQSDIFTWRNVVYDIKIKGEPRRLLDHVSGFVKPGTLTALMGVSGAGKTTLLDVLAHRTTMGVITGDMFVNGKPLDGSFQRKTGYVQQQDLHLATATVRESLQFSAMLRQPKSVSKAEKYAYVEDVIKMLDMEDFAEAVVGVPGEGLNVEQRKLLTIGVELAAKPKLLVFLDEPTSGLDSQSAWAICAFLRKLANAGQAVLCTIHQPSAILFQEFDRLLFLAKGGKTVYFGEVGEQSRTLLDYFEGHGARKCEDDENPAEYMLEIVNAGSSGLGQDWHEVWKGSEETKSVQTEIDRIHQEMSRKPVDEHEEAGEHSEFATPFMTQLSVVTTRVFQQYWRMPPYVIAKWMLGIVSGLFIGFSFFRANGSTQGIQNSIFSVFMVVAIFSSLVQQIMPLFITQRSLYEVRERPSKAYSWKAFIIANIVVEVPFNVLTGIMVFGCYHFAVTGIDGAQREGIVLLYFISLFVYAGTFAHMCIAALPDEQTAAAIVTLLFSMSLTFCGVLQSPSALPRFWIFMYRVSPFTYWVSGVISTQVHGKQVTCSSVELVTFNPPSGETCGSYLASYLSSATGYLENSSATSGCEYCPYTVADQFVSGDGIEYSQRWRNYGIFWVYIVVNIAAAVTLYYVFRVKKFSLGGISGLFKGMSPSSKEKPIAKNTEGEKQMETAQPF